MGPVSLALAAASLAVVYAARQARDRSVPILAWALFASLATSLTIHAALKSTGRATPLMLLDGVGLYATGLMAICRFDRPMWLYVMCAAFVLQCVAHLAYVCVLIPGNAHILVLNLLFGVELASLVGGLRKSGLRRPAGGRGLAFGRSSRWRPAWLRPVQPRAA